MGNASQAVHAGPLQQYVWSCTEALICHIRPHPPSAPHTHPPPPAVPIPPLPPALPSLLWAAFFTLDRPALPCDAPTLLADPNPRRTPKPKRTSRTFWKWSSTTCCMMSPTSSVLRVSRFCLTKSAAFCMDSKWGTSSPASGPASVPKLSSKSSSSLKWAGALNCDCGNRAEPLIPRLGLKAALPASEMGRKQGAVE